jgi:diacylglycerol kinase family enzyme
MIRTSEVAVLARRRKLRVSLDGEIFAFKSPVAFRTLERALRVVVPAGSKRAQECADEMRGGISFAS